MENTTYHLHTISGLHVGTGQGVGVIDMPIARERATNLPQVPGSGIKGVLRDELNPECTTEGTDGLTLHDYLALFGPSSGEDASKFAGALMVGDAKLLCLPIRAWKGTFAWVTCPMILERYQRDQAAHTLPKANLFDLDASNQAIHTTDSKLLETDDSIYLEDLDLTTKTGADEWANFISEQVFQEEEWQTLFKQRFLIVNDDIFDFLSETATEIRARIKIKEDTRTVQEGGLWYEEYLPAETILWGVLAADRSRNPDCAKTAQELLSLLPKDNHRLQIGGNATVGAGQVRWIRGE